MITIKQWKEFKKYCNNQKDKWFTSKEYKELRKRELALIKLPIKKTWLGKYIDYDQMYRNTFELSLISIKEKAFKRILIPEETVEECLNWLARGKK